MESELSIGKLAEAARVNIETIRYYQRRGLLDEPTKPFSGHRRYSAEATKRVRFIKRAQALDAACACTETRALAARKLSLIEQKMADLAAMRQALGGLVQQCDTRTGGADCPIIDALGGA